MLSPWEREVRFNRHWSRDTYDKDIHQQARKWRRWALGGWLLLALVVLVESLKK